METMDNWETVDIQDAIISVLGVSEDVVNPLKEIASGRLLELKIAGISDPLSKNKHKRRDFIANLNQQPITLSSPKYYSIGLDPTSLWFATDSVWYSIHPADSYYHIWLQITRAITMFFSAEEYYQEDPDRVSLPVSDQILQILLKGATLDGSGATLDECLQRCEDDCEFLTHHMKTVHDVESPVHLKDTAFYAWMSKVPPMAKVLESAEVNITELQKLLVHPGITPYQDGDDEITDEQGDVKMDDDEDPTPARASAPAAPRGISRPHKGEYISPQRPAGSGVPQNFVDIFLAVTYHIVHTNRDNKTLATLSAPYVGNTVYRDFSISRPETAARLLRDNARAIYNALLPAFQQAKVGNDLRTMTAGSGPIVSTNPKNTRKANDQWGRIVSGAEILKQRGGVGNVVTFRPAPVAAPPRSRERRNGSVRDVEMEKDIGVEEEDGVVDSRVIGPKLLGLQKPIKRSRMYDE